MNNISVQAGTSVGELKVLVTDGTDSHPPHKLALMAAEALTEGSPEFLTYHVLKVLTPYFDWYRNTHDSTLVDKAVLALRQSYDSDQWRLQFASTERISTIKRILAHSLSMCDKE